MGGHGGDLSRNQERGFHVTAIKGSAVPAPQFLDLHQKGTADGIQEIYIPHSPMDRITLHVFGMALGLRVGQRA